MRADALFAYAALDPAGTMPAIRDALSRDSWLDITRAGAISALRKANPDSAWTLLPTFPARRYQLPARATALSSLLAIGRGREAEVARMVEPLLDDPDLRLRIFVAPVLGSQGRQASVDALVARRKIEPESRVINAIDEALEQLRR